MFYNELLKIIKFMEDHSMNKFKKTLIIFLCCLFTFSATGSYVNSEITPLDHYDNSNHKTHE